MKKILTLFTILFLLSFIKTANAETDISAGKNKYVVVCISCHGADAKGNEVFPNLLKLTPVEATEKIEAYQQQKQIGPMSSIMWGISASLTPADIQNVIAYIESLKTQD